MANVAVFMPWGGSIVVKEDNDAENIGKREAKRLFVFINKLRNILEKKK